MHFGQAFDPFPFFFSPPFPERLIHFSLKYIVTGVICKMEKMLSGEKNEENKKNGRERDDKFFFNLFVHLL